MFTIFFTNVSDQQEAQTETAHTEGKAVNGQSGGYDKGQSG